MPLSKQIHQDKALEGVSVAYKPGEFIADRLVPTVPVKHESDIYYVYSTDIMSLPETLRANGAEANRAHFTLSTSSYRLEEHALKEVVTDRDRDNADKAINLEIDMTEILTRKILIRKEVECATAIQTSGNWSNSASFSSTQVWTANTTLSNPIINIDSGTSVVIKSSGYKPNVLVMDDQSFRGCKNHTSVMDRVKYTSADSITEQMLAKLFDVAQVLVARATYEAGGEGLTSSMSWIWTDTALLAYMESSPGLKKASAAYQLMKQNGGSPYKVTRWREDELDGDMIQVSSIFQFKAVATSCAYCFVNTA